MIIDEKDKVLYIDDEEPNLVSFKATFRRKYEVFLARNAAEGKEMLEKNPDIKVIISDQNMKGESGVDFFVDIMGDHPEPIRIILTGFTDHGAMTDAINKAHVYRFLIKPWNEIDFNKTIESGIELYNTRRNITAKTNELETAYNELNRFVYSASHDMRAPLVSIMGLIDLAKQDESLQKDEMYLPLIERSVMKLDTFVRNIVDYYQNKEKARKVVEINFEDQVNETIKSLEFYQDLSEIEIIKDIEISGPFHSDHFHIQVILNNLISNGLKYQRQDEPEKKITITIKTVNEPEDGCILSVFDNGIGIAKEDLPELFGMFYRATTQNTGSGIGLYIVSEAVKKIGGTIEVESEFGKYTIFKLFMPNLPKE